MKWARFVPAAAAALAALTGTAPPAAAGPSAPTVRSFTAAFTGDTLMHRPLVEQARRDAAGLVLPLDAARPAFDFAPMLAGLAPTIASVDLAVCHLETPIAPPGEPLSSAPLYGVPAEVASGLAATGYDRCSTASNHVLDRRVSGVDATVNALAAAGLGQSGMARTPAEIEPQVFEVRGVRVVHLSYTYSYNTLRPPPGEEWRSALIDPARIVADAQEARRRGAEVVVVSMHWGIEGRAEVTAEQRRVAEEITVAGAIDLVVGHHAHVLQPIEQINGRWVVFGLGNVVSNLPTSRRWPAASQDGAIASVTITVGADGAVTVSTPSVRPTWVDREAGWAVRDVRAGLDSPVTPEPLRAELVRSLERTTTVLGPYLVAPPP